MKKKSLAELGEFGLIEWICRQADVPDSFRLGIGDDCSIQSVSAGVELLTSTDLLIEGTHFNLSWTDFEQLGRKCVAVNVSDIAAMGGRPGSLYLGLGLPRNLSVSQLELFLRGFLAAARDYGVALVGGDTCASPGPFMISVTIHGEVARDRAVTRAGGGNGELLYVSGCLGDSALALSLLQREEDPPAELASRHHCPQARSELGQQLAERGLASAMIDISDGLLADLGHLLKASGLGATVELEALPLSEIFRGYLRTESDLIELALAGGEDYELLFSADPENAAAIGQLAAELQLPLTRIGQLESQAGLRVRQRDGSLFPSRQDGFDHFSAGKLA